jgi:hypothetical protein
MTPGTMPCTRTAAWPERLWPDVSGIVDPGSAGASHGLREYAARKQLRVRGLLPGRHVPGHGGPLRLQFLVADDRTRIFLLNNNTAYNQYRRQVNETNGSIHFQLAEFELLGK